MKKESSITVKEVINSFLCPIKIYYKGDLIYDDTNDVLFDVTYMYNDEIVHNFKVEFVEFHHSILEINY